MFVRVIHCTICKVVKILVEKRADVELNLENEYGQTALMLASHIEKSKLDNGHIEVPWWLQMITIMGILFMFPKKMIFIMF